MLSSLFPGETLPNGDLPIIAGPCSIESQEQIYETMRRLKECGIGMVRAGAWKPRTRPGAFEGVGEIGLRWMREAADELGLKVGTEVCLPEHARIALRYKCDFVWLGARTTGSPFVVEEIAKVLDSSDLTVLVKNPIAPDFQLWQGAVERLQRHHVSRIGLILRGFTTMAGGLLRNDPLWEAVDDFKSHNPELPILCDPSHISGDRRLLREIVEEALRRDYVGLFIESHYHPETALTDATQQIIPEEISTLLHGKSTHGDCALTAYREQVDKVDSDLIHLLSMRSELTTEIGAWKENHHLPALQSARLESMIHHHRRQAELYGISPDLVEDLFRIIHDYSLTDQIKRLKNENHSDKD